jgi:FkbM family methyltransferase
LTVPSIKDAARRIAVRLGMRRAILEAGKVAFPPGAPRVVQVKVNGAQLLVLANEDVGRRIALLRRYEPRDTRLLAGLVRNDDACIDVGANTGYYTMLMAGRARRGTVHAFEPVALNLHLLRAGVALNGWSHVAANLAAAGDRDGTIDFSEAADGAYSSLLPVGRKAEMRRIEVPIVRLDTYLGCHGPKADVMKVDVEGAEALVLEGAAGLLADPGRRPRAVMLELVDRNLEVYRSSVPGIVERMAQFGYRPFYAGEDGRPRAFERAHANVYENVFFAQRAADLGPA